MWKEGAILSYCGVDGYRAVDGLNIWDKVPLGGEYISNIIVEHPDNSDTFEEVYQSTLSNMYLTAQEMKSQFAKKFK